jgi:hypothetical protein
VKRAYTYKATILAESDGDVDEATVRNRARAMMDAAVDLLDACKAAYRELNEIHARDGVPYTYQGIKACVDEDYFASVVEQCRKAIAPRGGPLMGYIDISLMGISAAFLAIAINLLNRWKPSDTRDEADHLEWRGWPDGEEE